MKWIYFLLTFILANIIADIIFTVIIDPFIVPLTGARPVLAAVNTVIVLYPSLYWAYYKWIFKAKSNK